MGKKAVINSTSATSLNQSSKQLEAEMQLLQEEVSHARTLGREISEIEFSLGSLAQTLGEQTGIYQVPLDLIDRDEAQPRTVFPVALIRERVESLRRFGQLVPVILIPQINERYQLFDGELRYRSAQKLGWKSINAVFISVEEVKQEFTRFENQVITSIHSRRLHDLDLARALLRLLSYRYQECRAAQDRIPTILNTCLRRLERKQELEELSTICLSTAQQQADWLDTLSFRNIEERQIFELLLELQLNPLSINSNVFPLLKLADDLVEAIRVEGLESSKARELNKVTAEKLQVATQEAEKIRLELTAQVIENRFSLLETKALVGDLLRLYTAKSYPPTVHKSVRLVTSLNVTQIKDLSTLQELKKALDKKLQEVNFALSSN